MIQYSSDDISVSLDLRSVYLLIIETFESLIQSYIVIKLTLSYKLTYTSTSAQI